jgi:uncharacterized protein YndB with AHSA1/START domain
MNDVSDRDLTDHGSTDQDWAEPPQAAGLVFDYELDAPPEKVWRALAIAEFRERWLPPAALIDAEPARSVPGEEIGYRMRDEEPPFLESVVTFQLRPSADGGTWLRIIHTLAEAPQQELPRGANDNTCCLMRAA